MGMAELAQQLVSPEEWCELQEAMGLLEAGDFAAFYGRFSEVVRSMLFLESLEEFLNFAKGDTLDRECLCAAFLCGRGYGISVGGYEEDVTPALTEFLQTRGAGFPEVLEILSREKIYTDCDDFDNFKRALTDVDQVLDGHGLRVTVWEDGVYCGCEYTLLLLRKELAERVCGGWQSENFEIYL